MAATYQVMAQPPAVQMSQPASIHQTLKLAPAQSTSLSMPMTPAHATAVPMPMASQGSVYSVGTPMTTVSPPMMSTRGAVPVHMQPVMSWPQLTGVHTSPAPVPVALNPMVTMMAPQPAAPTPSMNASVSFDVGPDHRLAAKTKQASEVQATRSSAPSTQTMAIDTDGDGVADKVVTGIDANHNGVPDELEMGIYGTQRFNQSGLRGSNAPRTRGLSPDQVPSGAAPQGLAPQTSFVERSNTDQVQQLNFMVDQLRREVQELRAQQRANAMVAQQMGNNPMQPQASYSGNPYESRYGVGGFPDSGQPSPLETGRYSSGGTPLGTSGWMPSSGSQDYGGNMNRNARGMSRGGYGRQGTYGRQGAYGAYGQRGQPGSVQQFVDDKCSIQ